MKRFAAAVASPRAYGLAEGPVWDRARERVLWVDINAGDVHAGTLRDGTVDAHPLLHLEQTVGAVACRDTGELLVAGRRDVYRVAADGGRSPHARLIPTTHDSRLNDGACDPTGRFLVGSLALDERVGDESLYVVDRDGTVAVIDDDLTLSNGLGWSPDGAVLYSVDGGSPDGLCVDADGNLWIAIHGAGEVRCHAPRGDCLAVVTVPAPHPTSIAFVGPALDPLLITTAYDELAPGQRQRFPLSGHLFIADVGVTGLPTPGW
ncbi:MAG: SMP-30/gluconolactonase/LRE family protein [Solirubrobacteraceae bacterium]